jgi:hypothetical protein
LPNAPSVQSVVDLSGQSELTRFALSSNGKTALLVFRSDVSDTLFRWTSAGLSFVAKASKVSDVLLVDGDAYFTDSQSNEVILLRNIHEQVSMTVVADAGTGVIQPLALSLSSRREIYIATADSILILDRSDHSLRKLPCNCSIATITLLHDSIFRLTDELYRPMVILDGRSSPEQILMVPALSVEARESGQ